MAIDFGSFKDLNDPSKRGRDDKEPGVAQWWTAAPGVTLSDAVFSQAGALIQADKGRIAQYNTHGRLYGNQVNMLGGAGYTITTVSAGNLGAPQGRIAFNVIQSCIDTLVSKISKNKPKPLFLTSQGDSKLQRKAKKLDQFCTGVFYENLAYALMPLAFRDGCVWGEGVIQVFPYHGRVKWERVLPYQLLVDYLETHEGPAAAKTLHRVKNIDRTVLMEMLPSHKQDIQRMQGTNELLSSTQRSVADTVTVIESWRLPSAPDATDGVHTISAPGLSLLYEEYKKPFFPFAIFRYSPRLHGFWGQGLAEILTPLQTELNRCLMTVQRSFHLGASFKILLHASSKVVESHLDNTVGAIIKWAGEVPPQYVTPPLVQPEIYQQIATLKQMSYEQSGISQLSAASQKPAGLDSAVALREAVDIETDRFQFVGQSYEAMSLELAAISLAVGRDIYSEKKKLSVKVPGKKFIDTVQWREVDMSEDEYVMQVFPVSKLPSTPEGKLSTIQEMMQAGMIDPDTGRRLLDYPDLDAEENLANAQLDYFHKVLDAIVEDGEFEPPDPQFSIPVGMKMALEYYAVGSRDNLAEDRLEMLRRYIKQLNQLTAAAMPPAPPAGVVAPANPEPTPTSAMVPNVNGAGPVPGAA